MTPPLMPASDAPILPDRERLMQQYGEGIADRWLSLWSLPWLLAAEGDERFREVFSA